MSETRPKALIVDDDRLARTMLEDMLAPHFEVQLAASGDEALTLLGKATYAVVLSDQIMPGVTGVEVLSRCMEQCPSTVRILVSATESPKDIRDAVNLARVHRVIVKPLRELEVESIVMGALREHQLAEENARLVVELRAREAELERELRIRDDELAGIMAQVREVPR